MGAESLSSSTGVVEGIHGVRMMERSAFGVEEALIRENTNYSSCKGSAVTGTNQVLQIRRIWEQRPPCLRPIRCTLHGDQNISETVVNVLTSLPFVFLGLQVPRKNINNKLYANSLIGVGIASSLYHSSRGQLRKYLRWADYTMIATSTILRRFWWFLVLSFLRRHVLFEDILKVQYFTCMPKSRSNLILIVLECLSRALRNENPKLLMVASTLVLPFQPLMVSAVHTGLMEVAFAKKALSRPDLKMAHNLHKMSSLLGGAFFVADDCFPEFPYLHAAWHLAAAVGVGTCNKLLQ